MTDDEMLQFLCTELRAIKPELPEMLPLQAHYKYELDFDSLDLVELVARIEQRYVLLVPDGDLPEFISLDATMRYIRARTQA